MYDDEGEQSFTFDNEDWECEGNSGEVGIPYRVMNLLDKVMTHLEGIKLEEQSIHQIKELVDVACDLGEYDKKHNPGSDKVVVRFVGEAEEWSK